MRRSILACLPPLLAACDCGGYPASADRRPDDPPRELTCAGLVPPPPVELHELAAGGDIRVWLSRCGHLLADVDGSGWLSAPDLAALAPLQGPAGWQPIAHAFAPTGESLVLFGDDAHRLIDLATGEETTLGRVALEQGFFPSHDLDRSLLARCTDAGLVVLDRGVERMVAPGSRCSFGIHHAYLAPVALVWNAADEARIVDLERGTVLDTGLPLVDDLLETTPSGQLGYRSDLAMVSPDGSRMFHLKRWTVFEGDMLYYEGTGEAEVVDIATGAITVRPADGSDPVAIFRTGFLWSLGWEDRTPYAGAAGHGELGFRCSDARPYSGVGERKLLSCYHELSPHPWHDHVMDTRDLTDRDLGAPWSVLVVSKDVRAIAGCPEDLWRGGSCTEPVVRLWVDGNEIRDLPLERTADVVWVGDDGTLLAVVTERDEGLLLAPTGAVKARFPLLPDRDWPLPRVAEAGGVLLVKAESLELLVPATGFHRRLADAWVQAALDPSGERIAFTVPDGDGVRLLAGAVPTGSP
jgi:hypothetical protein